MIDTHRRCSTARAVSRVETERCVCSSTRVAPLNYTPLTELRVCGSRAVSIGAQKHRALEPDAVPDNPVRPLAKLDTNTRLAERHM